MKLKSFKGFKCKFSSCIINKNKSFSLNKFDKRNYFPRNTVIPLSSLSDSIEFDVNSTNVQDDKSTKKKTKKNKKGEIFFFSHI